MNQATTPSAETTGVWTQVGKGYQLNPLMKNTFTFSYICLLTTATITFIEALRSPTPGFRHVMNLETAVSLIGGYFYSVFVDHIQKVEDGAMDLFDWTTFTQLRYVDWTLTTPIMLTVLMIVMAQHSKATIHFGLWISVILLDLVMLGFGYAGETGQLPSVMANVFGFMAYGLMFYIIWRNFMAPRYIFANAVIFTLFVVVWGFYGVAYFLDDVSKNTAYNVLDVISKVFVGLGLWVYFTGIIGRREIP